MTYPMTIFASREMFSDVDKINAEILNFILDEDFSIFFKSARVGVDGDHYPNKLREMAIQWNENLEADAIRKVKEWFKKPKFDTLESHEVMKAFEMAENNFGPGTNCGVIIDGTYNTYFATRIPEDMLEDAKENPQKYFIIEAGYDF